MPPTELIEANGFQDRITLIRKKLEKSAPARALRRLVTETLSAFCFDTENVIEFVATPRERFVKPGAPIIPESAEHISDAFFRCLRRGPPRPVTTTGFQAFSKRSSKSMALCEPPASRSCAQPARAFYTSTSQGHAEPGNIRPVRHHCDGRRNGLGWFEARLRRRHAQQLPYLPLTHWWQFYLPSLSGLTIAPAKPSFLPRPQHRRQRSPMVLRRPTAAPIFKFNKFIAQK